MEKCCGHLFLTNSYFLFFPDSFDLSTRSDLSNPSSGPPLLGGSAEGRSARSGGPRSSMDGLKLAQQRRENAARADKAVPRAEPT
jgi:hypothetical protein